MTKTIALIFCLFLSCSLSAQTYKQLAEQALTCIEKDSLPKAQELLKAALKLEPTNPRNALLLSNLGTVQRRMEKYEDAIESYTLALNLSATTVPI
ncbi:MAG: tetratricopeptide repeat protein, partial [Bacteroides sp.]